MAKGERYDPVLGDLPSRHPELPFHRLQRPEEFVFHSELALIILWKETLSSNDSKWDAEGIWGELIVLASFHDPQIRDRNPGPRNHAFTQRIVH